MKTHPPIFGMAFSATSMRGAANVRCTQSSPNGPIYQGIDRDVADPVVLGDLHLRARDCPAQLNARRSAPIQAARNRLERGACAAMTSKP